MYVYIKGWGWGGGEERDLTGGVGVRRVGGEISV